MGLFENLMALRIHQVLSLISTYFFEYISASPYETVDVGQCIDDAELSFTLEFRSGDLLIVVERYTLSAFTLEIDHYNYLYVDSSNKPIVSYDNSPHHPEVSSFPHHKHYYPKRTFRPLPFSGDLLDALSEIKWSMTSRGQNAH